MGCTPPPLDWIRSSGPCFDDCVGLLLKCWSQHELETYVNLDCVAWLGARDELSDWLRTNVAALIRQIFILQLVSLITVHCIDSNPSAPCTYFV